MPDVPCPCLVDTNVAKAANLQADVSEECVIQCIRMIRDVTRCGHLVVDNLDLIYTEYRKNLSLSGRPGVGDAFMRWVNDHRFDDTRCTRAPITPTDGTNTDFAELAAYPDLSSFDPSDKKFLATALAQGDSPPILVACDTDYWNARERLKANGITIEFLCRDDIERTAARKQKRK
jgi:hypothetical protein